MQIKHGNTSNILRFMLRHLTTNVGLTGLTKDSAGLIIATICDNEATTTVYTQAAGNIETIAALGTYAAPTASKCRFKEVDATNHKGLYEFQFADARFAVSTAESLVISVTGAANLLDANYDIELVSFDPHDAVRLGLTALPNAAADAAGGLPISDAGGLNMDNLKTEIDGLQGTDGKCLISVDAQDLSGTLDVNTKTLTDGIITAAKIANAAFELAAFAADVGSTPYASNTIALAVRKALDEIDLDHLLKIAESSNVTTNSVIAKLASADGNWANFSKTTDSLQSIRDVAPHGSTMVGTDGANTTTPPTVAAIRTEMDSNSVDLNSILAYVDELESRLTAVRAGYLDNLSVGAVAQASICTEERLAELDAAKLPADIAAVKAETAAIKVKTDNQPAGIPKNVALSNFVFLMVLKSDHITPATGKVLTEEISKDGGDFVACTNNAVEISHGLYRINITQDERNADVSTLKFSEKDCDQRTITIVSSK